jgi:hypothetical protein
LLKSSFVRALLTISCWISVKSVIRNLYYENINNDWGHTNYKRFGGTSMINKRFGGTSMINNIDVTPTQTSLEVKKTKPN